MITIGIYMLATFLASAVALLFIGFLLRDLFSHNTDEESPRLELFPREPSKGWLDIWFFRFLEETGAPLENNAAILLVLGVGLIRMAIPIVSAANFLAAALGLIGGIVLSLLVLNLIRWWRVGNMRKNMPEALQIVADAVRSGHTLEESFDLVKRETKGPLQSEFTHAYSQLTLGHSPVSIMTRMVRRIPLPEFRVFATAVIVHQRAGGNLSLLTERMSHAARERQEVRGYLMAVTAGSRLSAFGMVFGSFVAMLILAALEPDYVSAFWTHRLGPALLIVAGCLQVLGILWVWRALRENY